MANLLASRKLRRTADWKITYVKFVIYDHRVFVKLSSCEATFKESFIRSYLPNGRKNTVLFSLDFVRKFVLPSHVNLIFNRCLSIINISKGRVTRYSTLKKAFFQDVASHVTSFS